MEPQSPRELIPAMMAKSRYFLDTAKRDVEAEAWPVAASRAYYAVFHAMTAALASLDLVYSKHSGVAAFFGQHFIKTGIFPREFSETIKSLRLAREMSDYSYDYVVDALETTESIALAERLVTAVEDYLTQRGLT